MAAQQQPTAVVPDTANLKRKSPQSTDKEERAAKKQMIQKTMYYYTSRCATYGRPADRDGCITSQSILESTVQIVTSAPIDMTTNWYADVVRRKCKKDADFVVRSVRVAFTSFHGQVDPMTCPSDSDNIQYKFTVQYEYWKPDDFFCPSTGFMDIIGPHENYHGSNAILEELKERVPGCQYLLIVNVIPRGPVKNATSTATVVSG